MNVIEQLRCSESDYNDIIFDRLVTVLFVEQPSAQLGGVYLKGLHGCKNPHTCVHIITNVHRRAVVETCTATTIVIH